MEINSLPGEKPYKGILLINLYLYFLTMKIYKGNFLNFFAVSLMDSKFIYLKNYLYLKLFSLKTECLI